MHNPTIVIVYSLNLVKMCFFPNCCFIFLFKKIFKKRIATVSFDLLKSGNDCVLWSTRHKTYISFL